MVQETQGIILLNKCKTFFSTVYQRKLSKNEEGKICIHVYRHINNMYTADRGI
jgi:hypothetical protein